jgi:hypothetical protein
VALSTSVQPGDQAGPGGDCWLPAEDHKRLLTLLEQINQTALEATTGGLSMTTVLTLLRQIDAWSDEAEEILRHAVSGPSGR